MGKGRATCSRYGAPQKCKDSRPDETMKRTEHVLTLPCRENHQRMPIKNGAASCAARKCGVAILWCIIHLFGDLLRDRLALRECGAKLLHCTVELTPATFQGLQEALESCNVIGKLFLEFCGQLQGSWADICNHLLAPGRNKNFTEVSMNLLEHLVDDSMGTLLQIQPLQYFTDAVGPLATLLPQKALCKRCCMGGAQALHQAGYGCINHNRLLPHGHNRSDVSIWKSNTGDVADSSKNRGSAPIGDRCRKMLLL